jgi:ArsR family transcriptional regulator
LSVPLKELERRLAELPQDREIVAYCRGPYCVLAVEAVEMLRGRGYVAFRLEDGVADWQARGLPVVADERETGRRD